MTAPGKVWPCRRCRALWVEDLQLMPEDGQRYERAGVPSYRVVGPHELPMVAWEPHGEGYVEVADLRPDDVWSATQPFELSFWPRDLMR